MNDQVGGEFCRLLMLSNETDIKIRKGQALSAVWKTKDIWKPIVGQTQLIII